MFSFSQSFAQELYVYSEPASNMPAHSISTKLAANFGKNYAGGMESRFTPEIMLGISKKLMVHVGSSFSNMPANIQKFESAFLYGKYRFLSVDDVHKHFRMAVFAEAAYSAKDYFFDEVNLPGERSGAQLGLIATQLLNKFAASATISHTQSIDSFRSAKAVSDPKRLYQSINYSLSAGYLLLPVEYTDYSQLNMNLYVELLGQRTLERKTFYWDLAPALQFIFNSNSKLNLGYRFQLDGDQLRNMKKSFLVSFEHTFFNALK